jgi:hypothetical protein
MRSTTKVNIWNRALNRIGATQLVQAETDTTPEAEACQLNYDDRVGQVLENVPWPWATKQAALNATAETRVGWDYTYLLPADCVSPIALLAEGQRFEMIAEKDRTPFELKMNDAGDALLLCTNVSEDDFECLEYVALIENPTLYPRQFVDAVVCLLAADLARSIKKDPVLARQYEHDYLVAKSQAWADVWNARATGAAPTTPSLAARE